ncbi:MAG: toxin-antitoxin system protein [Clostridiales bacterium]|jgi:hypothetical protein|nr:toxin-antitoxin system protein [Clostridiales bacterium]
MPHITFRVSETEKEWMESYAKLHGLSLSEAVKKAFFDKLEEEYDIAVAEEAYKEYLANPKTYSHQEVKEILGL